MAPRREELSFSQLVKEARRLDGVSTVRAANTSRNSPVSSKPQPKSEGVKIRARNKKLIKHTRLVEPSEKKDTKDTSLRDELIAAIREELRNFKQGSGNVSQAEETLYIPREDGHLESHIKSDKSREESDISEALNKLKKLKEVKK